MDLKLENRVVEISDAEEKTMNRNEDIFKILLRQH